MRDICICILKIIYCYGRLSFTNAALLHRLKGSKEFKLEPLVHDNEMVKLFGVAVNNVQCLDIFKCKRTPIVLYSKSCVLN